MSNSKNDKKIIKANLSTLLKKFSKSDVILDMEKEYQSSSVMMIDTSLIDDNTFLKKARLPDRILKSFATSIINSGVRVPLIIRTKKDHYEIVLGRKRLLAAKSIRVNKVPAVLQEISDEEMLLTLLADMRDRKDRNVVEMALVCQRLTKDYGFSQQSLALLTKQSRSQITNIVRILSLPDNILNDLSVGKLKYGHAKAIIALPESLVVEFAARIQKENLSVHDVERLVYEYKHNINNEVYLEKLKTKYGSEVKINKNSLTFTFEDKKSKDDFIKKLLKKETSNGTKKTHKRSAS